MTFYTLVLGLVISAIYITFSTILPHFDFYGPVMLFPHTGSIFSVYLILMFLLTTFTIIYFGFGTYKNAYSMFVQYRMFNMDTLLTLGSLAAYSMSILLIVVYALEDINDTDVTDTHKHDEDNLLEQVMNITHDFESAGLILTVITVGKYFEGKAK